MQLKNQKPLPAVWPQASPLQPQLELELEPPSPLQPLPASGQTKLHPPTAPQGQAQPTLTLKRKPRLEWQQAAW